MEESKFIVFRCDVCGLGLEIPQTPQDSFICPRHKEISFENIKRCIEITDKQGLKSLPGGSVIYQLSLGFRSEDKSL